MKLFRNDAVTNVNLMYGLVSFGAMFYSTLWMPFALQALNHDWAALAKISSMLWIGTVAGEIPTGILTDRWGARRALIAYAVLSFCAAALSSFAWAAPPLFLLAHLVQGVALSFLTGIFSLRLKEEQRASSTPIDFKRAVTQGAAYRSVLSVFGIAAAWISLRAIGPMAALPLALLVWALIIVVANAAWRALPVLNSKGSVMDIIKLGPAIYRRNHYFRNLSLARLGVDFGSAALVEYAISLVAPDLGEGSGKYLIFSMLFAGIRLFSSRAVAMVRKNALGYAFPAAVAIGAGLLLPAPALALSIVGLLFVIFYIDYQVHSEAIEALEDEGASTALSFQGLTMSLTSALALYLYGSLIPWLGKPGSMLLLLVTGISVGAGFYTLNRSARLSADSAGA